jgi:hypothetical protein
MSDCTTLVNTIQKGLNDQTEIKSEKTKIIQKINNLTQDEKTCKTPLINAWNETYKNNLINTKPKPVQKTASAPNMPTNTDNAIPTVSTSAASTASAQKNKSPSNTPSTANLMSNAAANNNSGTNNAKKTVSTSQTTAATTPNSMATGKPETETPNYLPIYTPPTYEFQYIFNNDELGIFDAIRAHNLDKLKKIIDRGTTNSDKMLAMVNNERRHRFAEIGIDTIKPTVYLLHSVFATNTQEGLVYFTAFQYACYTDFYAGCMLILQYIIPGGRDEMIRQLYAKTFCVDEKKTPIIQYSKEGLEKPTILGQYAMDLLYRYKSVKHHVGQAARQVLSKGKETAKKIVGNVLTLNVGKVVSAVTPTMSSKYTDESVKVAVDAYARVFSNLDGNVDTYYKFGPNLGVSLTYNDYFAKTLLIFDNTDKVIRDYHPTFYQSIGGRYNVKYVEYPRDQKLQGLFVDHTSTKINSMPLTSDLSKFSIANRVRDLFKKKNGGVTRRRKTNRRKTNKRKTKRL